MKITVLNGSPKGDLSITLQYARFIQKKFPGHEFKIFNVSEKISAIEKDRNLFQEIIDSVRDSQAVLWIFPLYYYLVPSQYKRFIELVWERPAQEAFRGRYAASLSTSIHFYDHVAHNYINAVSEDLELKYLDFYSADTDDLLKEEERKRICLFAERFFDSIEKSAPAARHFNKLIHSDFKYIPGRAEKKISAGNKKILILADLRPGQANLAGMIDRFKDSFSGKVEVANLYDIDIKGGCLGCIHCGFDNICIYGDKDGYMEFFNKRLKAADIIVFAGAIKDRYLSSRWKMFFDRSFFNTHIPSFAGKQMGYIVSGPLRQLPDLREILEAYAECMQANPAGFVTDEYEDSSRIDSLLQDMAGRIAGFADKGYIKRYTFLSIGARKVLRDEIWGKLRFVMQADDRYFRRHGMYDFPQKDIKARLLNVFMMLLTRIPAFRKEFAKHIKEEMVKPFKRLLESVK